MTEIRAGTYNILDGAGDGRAAGQLDMLTDAGLDMLFLAECMGADWTPGGDLRREWETRLGMWSRGSLRPGDGDGAGRHSLIFGRSGRIHPGTYKPLRTRTRNWRGSGMLEVTLDGYPHTVTVMAVHAHTLCPDTRASEVRHTARCSISLRPGPAIMAGDWNSVHGRPEGQRWQRLPPGDIEPDWDRVPPPLHPYHCLLDSAGNPVLDPAGQMVCDRRPSHLLTLADFRDGVADLIPDPHERPITGGWEPGDAPRRVDRIYLRYLTPAGCAVLDGPRAAQLSDHFAVYLDIGLSETARS